MAGKENGASGRSVQAYVQSKTVDQDGQRPGIPPGALDEFKLPTKPVKRGKKQSRDQRAARGGPLENGSRQHHTGEERPFYDTDASEIGPTSTTPSVRNDGHGPLLRGQDNTTTGPRDDDAESANESSSYSSSDENDFEYEYEDGNAGIAQGQPFTGEIVLPPRLRSKMHAMDREFAQQRPGANLPYIPGDSYADTTSGNPSIDRGDSERSRKKSRKKSRVKQAASDLEKHCGTEQAMPHPPPKAQQVPPTRTEPQSAFVKHGGEKRSSLQNGFFIRPAADDPFQAESNANFIFGKTEKAALPVRSGQEGGHQHRGSTNSAHRASAPSSNDVATGMPAPPLLPLQTAASMPRDGLQTKREPLHRRQGSRLKIEDELIAEGAPMSTVNQKDFNLEEARMTIDSSSSEEMEEPDTNNLDYKITDLVAMQYQGLKRQPFDTDPNGTTFNLSNETEHSTLESKIEAVATLAHSSQADFFASLSLDDWEQAGDWFITRFGEILDKLKAARREKRTAARRFEDEIERRHDVVGKKRKQTEDLLKEMKASGESVLQATPKRARPN